MVNVGVLISTNTADKHRPSGRNFCTATLLDDRTLVTASHCFYDAGSIKKRKIRWYPLFAKEHPQHISGAAPVIAWDEFKDAPVVTDVYVFI